jgi:co-chaperonin GroES (HSP10)
MPEQLDLIDVVYAPDRRFARIDTNGQRVLNSAQLRVVASRLLDAAVNTSEECPLVPFGDQIIVSIIYEEGRKSAGNVDIPDTAQENSALRGIVEAVGPRVHNRPWWQFWIPKEWIVVPKRGDIVTFSPHAGTVTKVGDSRYLTMKAVYALTKIVLDADDEAAAAQPAA